MDQSRIGDIRHRWVNFSEWSGLLIANSELNLCA